MPTGPALLKVIASRILALVSLVLLVGMITGIDGLGFAGLPLTGALSGALGPVAGIHPTTLAAVGQMGALLRIRVQ